MKKNFNLLFSKVVSFVLIAAMALTLCSCGKADDAKITDSTVVSSSTGVKEIGNGQTKFMFNVYDQNGNKTSFEVHTDKKTVGEALTEVDLIKGTTGDYGLMVTEVNGIVADYNVDKTYWAFYVDGNYAEKGVDSTDVVDGSTYEFKVEK